MRTVFSNDEVAHIWAQRTHFDGRNQSRSLFFEGGNLYSYGYHYLLGEFISNENNDVAVIINTDNYSVPTSKHCSLAWMATTQYTQFERKFTEEKSVIKLLNELETKLLKARKPLIYINEANTIINNYMEYLDFMHGRGFLPESVLKAFKPFRLDSDELKALQDKDKERLKKRGSKAKREIGV